MLLILLSREINMSAGEDAYSILVMLLERVKSSPATLQHGRCIHQTCEKCDWVTAGNAATERHHRLASSEARIFFVPFREDHLPLGNNSTECC
jgi:hypothetical protein